ncbi:MAG: hypothetical protein MUQ32_03955, partial [Chloroflexi bacterium]|nr:hypothetical protein [Chloroflexota bacterium]
MIIFPVACHAAGVVAGGVEGTADEAGVFVGFEEASADGPGLGLVEAGGCDDATARLAAGGGGEGVGDGLGEGDDGGAGEEDGDAEGEGVGDGVSEGDGLTSAVDGRAEGDGVASPAQPPRSASSARPTASRLAT